MGYIQESEIEILWTASETNVADLVTKEVKPSAHVNSTFWANGPTYLKKSDCDWKEERKLEYIRLQQSQQDILQDPAVRKEMKVKKNTYKNESSEDCTHTSQSKLVCEMHGKINNLIKVQRIVIVCMRAILSLCDLWKWNYPEFIRGLPHLLKGYTEEVPRSTYEEMKEVLNLMIENEQIAAWPEEMEYLKDGKEIEKPSFLFQFKPFLETNLIRMRTRLEYGEHLSEQTRFPIILPKDSKLTYLIIMHQHVQTSHCGAEQTKRLIRNNYWIIGSKRKIKSVLKQCKNRECQKWQLKPIAVPPLL